MRDEKKKKNLEPHRKMEVWGEGDLILWEEGVGEFVSWIEVCGHVWPGLCKSSSEQK